MSLRVAGDGPGGSPPERETSWRRLTVPRAPTLVLLAVVAFNAWILRSELAPVHYPNDGSFHLAYLGWATDRVAAGDSPLDGIFTPLGLGFPLFQHYQVLPYLLTAPLAWLFGVQDTYVAVLYLLLVLWPVCLYASLRLMAFDRWAAAGAAVCAPFVMSVSGYGFELGSYVWRGSGMWTQAWGMWLGTLALACCWRSIFRGRSMALAAVLLAASLTSHVLTGLLVAAVVAAWGVLAAATRVRQPWRVAAVVGGAGLASAWLLVPSLVDREATYFDNPPGTEWSDSYGVGRVTSWLWRGEVFDQGRWPVLTVLAAVGLAVLVRRARRDDNARAVLVLAGVSLALFFGATVVGPIVDRIPGREMLFLHRAVVGVHLGGVVMAGVGGATLLRAAGAGVARLTGLVAARWAPGRSGPDAARPAGAAALAAVASRPAVATVAGALVVLAVMAPAWTQVRAFMHQQEQWIDEQRAVEATDGRDFAALAGIAAGGGGRISAGTRGGWGDSYRIGHLPAYIELLNLGVDGVGFTGRVPALTEPSEARYTGEAAGQSEAFDVRWHIRPAGMAGPPAGERVASQGRHVLWRVDTTGPVAMIDTTSALRTDRAQVAVVSAAFFNSTMPLEQRYPLLSLDGADAGAGTLLPGSVDGPPGEVASVEVDDGGNEYTATVSAERLGALLVKTSFHPRWSAAVDGEPVEPVAVAPGLLAVEVPAGRHEVTVRFAGFPLGLRLGLVAVGMAAIAGLVVVDRTIGARWEAVPGRRTGRPPAGDGRGPAEIPPPRPSRRRSGSRYGRFLLGRSAGCAGLGRGDAVGELGVELDGAGQLRGGLVAPPELLEQETEVEVRGGVVLLEGGHLLVEDDRLGGGPGLGAQDGEVEGCRREVRIDRQCAAVVLLGVRVPPGGLLDQGEVVEGELVAVVGLDGLAVQVLGLVEVAVGMGVQALLDQVGGLVLAAVFLGAWGGAVVSAVVVAASREQQHRGEEDDERYTCPQPEHGRTVPLPTDLRGVLRAIGGSEGRCDARSGVRWLTTVRSEMSSLP